MAVNPVYRAGRIYGFKWGLAGRTYPISRYGTSGAIGRAEHQGRAIYTSRSPGASTRGMFKMPKKLTRRRKK